MLPYSQAAENNKEAIAGVLRETFADIVDVLEIGTGTGQHAVHFGRMMPHLKWQTSDLPDHLEAIRERLEMEGPANVLAPVALDVAEHPCPVDRVEGIFSANSVHIMSWVHVEHLFHGVGRALADDGVLCLYGPYKYDGAFTTESNAAFDRWLKDRDPLSGIRDFEAVDAVAGTQGLSLVRDHVMPANNQLLVWRRV